MKSRILTLMWKEFAELRQSPRLLGLLIVAPVVQLTMLGYAATTDIKNVPIVVVDGDRSALSRKLIEQFDASSHFEIVAEEAAPSGVNRHLERGDAWLALVVPAGFQRSVERNAGASDAPAEVQVLADGTDSNSSGVALAYANGLISAFNASILAERGARVTGIDSRVRVWFNPELVSRDFMVPGVLALLLLVITANLSSMAIVRERELGTLEQLNVTPLGRWELILGKLLPYGLVGFIDVLLVVSVAVLWFEVPLRGSLALLLAGSATYLLCTLGLGLLVSTISSTQQQAMMTATFFFLVPMVYLSGFIFPIENMPRLIRWVTTIIPLRYFLVIVRGIFLKGVGLDVLWPQFAALGAWGVTVIALAGVRSRKRA
ncbi:MAG TPA: ABC transporter permease [Vicinamibacterales bacterium]|nr:ABC transporter permease [Vicinamibacterales bacterium]